jgi:hypothetical protein
MGKELEKFAKEKVKDSPPRCPPMPSQRQRREVPGGTPGPGCPKPEGPGLPVARAAPDLAFIAGSVIDGKPLLAVSLGKAFMDGTGLKAGDLIKQLGPLIKGGGGGQPDFATAGGKEPGGMAEALKKAAELLG